MGRTSPRPWKLEARDSIFTSDTTPKHQEFWIVDARGREVAMVEDYVGSDAAADFRLIVRVVNEDSGYLDGK